VLNRNLSERPIEYQAPYLGRLSYQDYKEERNEQSIDMWKMPYWRAMPDGELKTALSEWARAFNADVDWVKDIALHILEGWHVNTGWRETLKWRLGREWLITIPNEDFDFHFAPWEFEREPWLAYKELLEESIHKKVLAYEKSSRELALSHDLVRAPRQYSQENFDWFVLHEFVGEFYPVIARRFSQHLDPVTVRKGVKTAAKLLRWQHLRAPQHKPTRKTR
jgi:hypothetical protein